MPDKHVGEAVGGAVTKYLVDASNRRGAEFGVRRFQYARDKGTELRLGTSVD